MEIEKAVEAADAIIVCLTKNSINKEGYVQRELRTVLDFAHYKPEGTLYIIPCVWKNVSRRAACVHGNMRIILKVNANGDCKDYWSVWKRRADGLGLMAKSKEEAKKAIPAKPFTKLLDPSSLSPKGISRPQGIAAEKAASEKVEYEPKQNTERKNEGEPSIDNQELPFFS